MSDEHDSWFESAFGFNVGEAVQAIKDEASAAVTQATSAVTQAVQAVGSAVDEVVDGAAGVASGVVTKVAGAVGAGGGSGAVPPSSSGAVDAGGTGTFPLRGSVGRGGQNQASDVRAVQAALGIGADGKCGPQTIAAIEAYQRDTLGLAKPDGRVDPGGNTEQRLVGGASPSAPPPPSEAGGATDEGLLAGLKSAASGLVDGVTSNLGAGSVLAVMPGLPMPIPGLPGIPMPTGPVPFPPLPGETPFNPSFGTPTPVTGPGVGGGAGTSGGVGGTLRQAAQIAMEGIALFDALIVGGLLVVSAGVIAGLYFEVKSSEEIAGLPADVTNVTSKMVEGYRTAMRNGPQPGEDAGRAGWLVGNDIFKQMRIKLAEQNPGTTDEEILQVLAAGADKGGEDARPVLRDKAKELVWISYASKHQDSAAKSYLNERFRAWGQIFQTAPQGNEKLWKDYINEHTNTSSPYANLGGDKDPRSAPSAPVSGPATDPSTGQPLSAPSTPTQPSTDPNSNNLPAVDPEGDDTGPLEFTAEKLPPTAKEFFERVKNSKTPVVFRNLSLDVMNILKAKYGCDLAFGLQQHGTIGSYEAWQVVVAGCGGDFHAHHIVERKVLSHLGYTDDKCPAVILTAQEHIAVSKILAIELPPGELDAMTRKEILSGYEKAYQNHPEWMRVVRPYFR